MILDENIGGIKPHVSKLLIHLYKLHPLSKFHIKNSTFQINMFNPDFRNLYKTSPRSLNFILECAKLTPLLEIILKQVLNLKLVFHLFTLKPILRFICKISPRFKLIN